MEFVVTDVTKPLAAVSAIVEAGNRVVFDKQGSFVQNTTTGERIELTCEKGTYTMEVDVDMIGVCAADEADSSGFTRQA